MACGAPVVASEAGALREVVRAGGGGVLVPTADPEALARALKALLDAPEERRALGARGRERVVERFSWPRIARATVDAYAEVLETRGRPASSTTSAWRGSRRAHAPSA
jgi:glycosyltransferase involved in cell wall biosynthesis